MKFSLKSAAILVAVAGSLNLGAQKIAHLSFDSLISLMPETKVAEEAAREYLKSLEQEMTGMKTELENKYNDYMANQQNMSEMIRKNKEDDLQQLQSRIQEFQRQAELDYRRKQTDLTQPIMAKAKKGIEAVAKEGGFKYVLDTSPANTAVLYSEGDDILMQVKKKLDAMPPAAIPGVNTQGTGGVKQPQPQQNNTQKSPPQPAKSGKK